MIGGRENGPSAYIVWSYGNHLNRSQTDSIEALRK
jgi:hypothetical protein